MLKKPTPGLRRLHNRSNQVAKVQVNVGPYDELEVSEDVASQLLTPAGTQFAEGAAPPWFGDDEDNEKPEPKKTPAKKAAPAKRAAKKS